MYKSATNATGDGMLQALGMKLLSKEGVELNSGGGALIDLHAIDSSHFDKRIVKIRLLIFSDWVNPG
ncbi:glycerate kinase [Lederbergia lenta]|uniref:glycerate kinase n=1 Tax=Lederbergia lenta TaxID=1467 RepID=UPI002367CDE4|nr:glycerate kinase [Lederbergia lenta]MEC2324398.1 glycerate kinase [Lederbergia lenta]